MSCIYNGFLPSGKKKIRKIGTSSRLEWRWRNGARREEGLVVVEGEGKEDHIVFSLSQRSLLQRRKGLRKKSLRKDLCFLRECSKCPRADGQGWRGLPLGQLRKTTPHRAEGSDLVKFCNRAGSDRFLPDDATRKWLWK